MKAFYVTLQCDNAAFDGSESVEVARILKRIAADLDNSGLDSEGDSGKCRDVNGNTVGSWQYETE